ncbi:hypothetical protein [Maritimibacter alkaliphilus]|uniref:hypothetical protein n=1 Tax=Maritimibacter alkaliphilus TaxID=404236 RepID=UPI00032425F6|nr:hypothetical protein [Maritimibacter alkaliphilus]
MTTEPVHPFPNGLPAHDYASPGEQLHDISSALREPVVDPHGESDDFARESVTSQAEHLSWFLHNDRLNSTAGHGKLAMLTGYTRKLTA